MGKGNKAKVIGGTVQLGQFISKVTRTRSSGATLFLDEIEGTILDLNVVYSRFLKGKPYFVINYAAYTAVDTCLQELNKIDSCYMLF